MAMSFIGALVPLFTLAIFGLAFGMIISTLIKNGKQNRKNDASPPDHIPGHRRQQTHLCPGRPCPHHLFRHLPV